MNSINPSQSAQASAPSVVEMTVFVILFLWIASLPSNQSERRRPARHEHHLSAWLHSRFEGWMQTGLQGSSLGAA